MATSTTTESVFSFVYYILIVVFFVGNIQFLYKFKEECQVLQ